MIRTLLAYLLSTIAAYILAVVMATQSVVSQLDHMGLPVGIGQRISMTMSDIVGMAGVFLPLITAGFLVAFLVTALLVRWLGQWKSSLFVLAGALALIAVHLLMKIALGITPVAAARSWGGLLGQGLAGAVGGYLFAALTIKSVGRNKTK